jgi:ABC-type lipoprotein release transport system permease subunit
MKKLLTSSRIALRALQVNRTRSALTMLGIIIGVAAVIAMVGVGAGATERIQAQIQSIGSNLIIVLPGSISSNGVRLGSGGVAASPPMPPSRRRLRPISKARGSCINPSSPATTSRCRASTPIASCSSKRSVRTRNI